MKKIPVFYKLQIFGILFLGVSILSGCAPQAIANPSFQGISWGTQAAEIIHSAQSEDYFLATENESVVTIYGFNKEAALTMGGYILRTNTLEVRVEQTMDVLAELTDELGVPNAGVFKNGDGSIADTWENALREGGTVQFFWVTPDSETCQLDVGTSTDLRITITAPGVLREGTGFNDIMWGTPIEEVEDYADWSTWFLIQGTTSVSDLPATAVYRFDLNGGLFQGEYFIDVGATENIENTWDTVIDWLEEEYDISDAEMVDHEVPYGAKWNCGSTQIVATYDFEFINLTFTNMEEGK